MPLAHALAALSLAAGAPVFVWAQTELSPLTLDRASEVAYIVRGIAQYTRWTPPPAPIRLCLSDTIDPATETAFIRAVTEPKDGSTVGITVVSRRISQAAGIDATECHVLLVNSKSPLQWQPLLLGLLGRPVLTIGFDEDFCSIGGMFCLDNSSGKLQIRANLDTISRSGVRINPQLLRLTQQRNAGR
jgi:hypothetical protein